MSAVLQLPLLWAARSGSASLQPQLLASAVHHIQKQLPQGAIHSEAETEVQGEAPNEPVTTWAFYRKHTERLLRRYLYASMQVGRSPDLLGASVGRGWVSSRRVRTFEDALIFVLDVERSSGSHLVDARTGARYLDMFTFFASSALGMNHPALADPCAS